MGRVVLEVGMDEAGRTAWAGELVAGAVVAGPELEALDIRGDSKALSQDQVALIANEIIENARAFGLGVVAVHEINKWGLAKAQQVAYQRALENLRMALAEQGLKDAELHITIDGNFDHLGTGDADTVPRADETHLAAMAASLIAKYEADQYLNAADAVYPQYGLRHNKGYQTADHARALRLHGLTPYHRWIFASVQRVLNEGLWNELARQHDAQEIQELIRARLLTQGNLWDREE